MSQPFYVSDLTRRRFRRSPLKLVQRAQDVVALVGRRIRAQPREHFMVLLLNARHECMAIETVSVGTLTASLVHPRECLRPAIVASSAAIIVAHNHPSGDPEPSQEDVALTRRLFEAGELMGIALLDHLVIAKRGAVSLRERGVL